MSHFHHRRLAAAFLAALTLAAAAQAGDAAIRCRWPSPNDRRPLDLVFRENPLLVALPGDCLEVTVESAEPDCRLCLQRDGQIIREDRTLSFTAPDKPGSYFIPLDVRASGGDRRMELCVVVPEKATGRRTGDGLNIDACGQNVGSYRSTDRSGNNKVKANPESYQPPVWWFKLTEDNGPFAIVPGVRAEELVAPTEDTGLKHTDTVPVSYPMWTTIMTIRENLPRIGVPPEAMQLISVFRAPAYNRAVGSNAFGRHIYGDAFDFYLGKPGPEEKAMDLNRDGKLDRRDAYPVVALVEDLQAEGKIPMGGIGVYNTVGGDHVVTMHVDVRGHRATWGYLYSASGKRSEFCWQSRRHAELDRREEAEAAERAAREGRPYQPPRREPLGP